MSEFLVNETGESEGLDSGNYGDHSGYPIISWQNGDQTDKRQDINSMDYVGGFFLATVYRHNDKLTQWIPESADKSQYTEVDMAPYGWAKEYFVATNGNKVYGWWRKQLEAAFIAGRDQWVIILDEAGKRKRLGFTEYRDAEAEGQKRGTSPRGVMQVLAIVKGMEDFGPVVFSFKGFTMKSFKGQAEMSKHGVISQLQARVTTPGGQLMTKDPKKPVSLFYRSVWCKFGPLADEKGVPQFYKAGKGEKSKMIAIPAYQGGTVTSKDDLLANYYVGDVVGKMAKELFDNSQEWIAAWKNLKGKEEAGAAEPEADTAATADAQLAAAASKAGL